MPDKNDSADSLFQNIDSLFQNVQNVLKPSDEPERIECVSFWLPEKYKAKFDLLQSRTNRKAGKLLQEVLKKSIDKIDAEAI